jgi:hypothetical protein
VTGGAERRALIRASVLGAIVGTPGLSITGLAWWVRCWTETEIAAALAELAEADVVEEDGGTWGLRTAKERVPPPFVAGKP